MLDTTASHSTTTASRTPLGLLLLLVACAAVLLMVGTTNGVTSRVQRPADREAETFADGYLLEQLTTAADGPDAADGDRTSRVEALLQSMTGELVPGSYESILVGPRNGDSFPVAVYSYWHDKSFSGGAPYYGRACRTYTVGEPAVTTEPVDCPASVPEQPTGGTLTNEGWRFS